MYTPGQGYPKIAAWISLLLMLPPLNAVGQGALMAITHVTIVDVEDGSTKPDLTVLIREGRIARVEGAAVALPDDAEVMDGRQKFLIPGLWDMHVHLSWTTESALPVFVANGVTGVRDTGSDLAEIDAWRAKIEAGVLVRSGGNGSSHEHNGEPAACLRTSLSAWSAGSSPPPSWKG